jgi:hypothetical protein
MRPVSSLGVHCGAGEDPRRPDQLAPLPSPGRWFRPSWVWPVSATVPKVPWSLQLQCAILVIALILPEAKFALAPILAGANYGSIAAHQDPALRFRGLQQQLGDKVPIRSRLTPRLHLSNEARGVCQGRQLNAGSTTRRGPRVKACRRPITKPSKGDDHVSWSSSTLASLRTGVSKPSVNQP